MTDFEADAFRALVAVAADEPDRGASAWQVAQVMGGGCKPSIVGGALARLVRSGILEVVGMTPGCSRRYGTTTKGLRILAAVTDSAAREGSA